ncbi:MAG: MATE family efflux transporter [Alphaproteobacteria bacterium]|nr:MATE family efflux transporter [Alphaproteobacteria bacterium]
MQVDYKNIFKMSYPILISMLMQQLIGITDIIFLGRLGEVELGASALGSTYFFTIFMVAFGFSIGAQIIMARRNGEQNYEKIGQVFYQGCTFLILSGLVFAVLSYFFTPELLNLLIESKDICQDTIKYVNCRIWGLIPASLIIMARGFFVSITRTYVLSIVSVIMVLTNVILNYMLIFGKFGVPELGISGAAIASVLAETIAVIAYVIYFVFRVELKKYGFTHFVYKNFSLLKSILSVSIWTMLQQFISVSTWFLFFITIEHLGERELAISNIVRSLSSFPFVVVNALAAAISSITANLIGENKTDEVINACIKVLKLCTYIMVPLLCLMSLGYYPFLRIYTDNVSLINQSVMTYLVMLGGFISFIPAWIIFNAVSGTGNTQYAMKIEFYAMITYLLYICIVVMRLKLSLPICWGADWVYNLTILFFSYRYFMSYKWCNKQV